MDPVFKLFGASGFNIPLSILIDNDAAQDTADDLGLDLGDLNAHSIRISDPDLEAEYVHALGAASVWKALDATSLFSSAELAATGPGATRTADDLAEFCRHKKRKVRAAMAVLPLINGANASAIKSVNELLSDITAL
jgi:putative ATP-dependent endonuclease of OLD family